MMYKLLVTGKGDFCVIKLLGGGARLHPLPTEET